MTVFEVIRNIIVEIKDINPENITKDSSFEADLEADSLDMVEMLMLLEEKYEIQIPEEAAEAMQTVQDAINYIEERLAEKI